METINTNTQPQTIGETQLLPPPSNTTDESAEDLIFEFIRDRTPTTAASYRDDLKAFFDFTQKYFALPRIEGPRCHFEDIKRVHLVKYKTFLETEPCSRGRLYAPNSVNRKLSSISSFYQFLVRREIIDKNPVSLIIRPKHRVVRETEAFTDREMKHLFEIVLEQAPILHKVTLLTMFLCGAPHKKSYGEWSVMLSSWGKALINKNLFPSLAT